MPIFDDERDEVSWIAARAEKPPPPPPFEKAPERPLFAPEPPEGRPLRTPRPGAAPTGQDYWPWDGTGPGAGRTGSHTGTQPGLTGTGSGIGLFDDFEDDGVPGRRWLRLAAVVGACILLLLAVVFAFNLGQGRSALEFEDEPDTNASSSAPADAGTAVVAGTVATDLDPQGEDREENPDLTPNAVDGNPTTSWRTATYDQQLGPAGLKTGVGLVVDLGSERDVRRIRVDFVGEPTSVSLYVTPELPTAVAGLQPVAIEAAGRRLDGPVEATGRYGVIWLTSLPAVEGGFRGEISDVVVRA